MYSTGVKLSIFWSNINSNIYWSNIQKQLTTIKDKTWSRGTNSRLPFGVNVNLNLSIILFQSIVNLQRNASIIGSEGWWQWRAVDKRLIKARDNGSWRGVIVLSFFDTDYRYVHYTKSAGPLGFFFFLQHIGIQDMMAAI